jgi:hypothetical protein
LSSSKSLGGRFAVVERREDSQFTSPSVERAAAIAGQAVLVAADAVTSDRVVRLLGPRN